MRETSFSAVVLAVIALAALPGALASPATRAADPGITSTTILLGGTAPLTGPAAAYASVARGAKAYFDSVNAKGGVAGRKIQYKYLDDGYDPAQTVQDTRQLVEQDKAFAIFNTLGTEVNLSIRDYLNAHKIPQLFAASGATTFGRDVAQYPWTIGFQPSYQAEGWVLGQYLAKTKKRGKVGVLFQNDDYGKDLLGGFKRGLQSSGVKVVAAQPYEVTASDVSSQVAKLKASHAGIFAIFATPKFAIQAYVFANRLGWRPAVIDNAVSAASNIMLLASEGGKNKAVEGTVALNFLKDPTDVRWKKDPGVRTYRAIMSKYAKGAKGTLDSVLVCPRQVFKDAITSNAAAIALVHNHPSGDPTPSEADIKVTRDLIRAGQLLKIDVLDHIIIGKTSNERSRDYVSLRELGYFYS